jgi:hypothetical protein
VIVKELSAYMPGTTVYNTFIAVCEPESEIPTDFEIEVSYFHSGIGQRVTDKFPIDLMDYKDSAVIESEIYEHGNKMRAVLEKLTSEVGKLNNNITRLTPISGSTGLDLSISTLRNLKHVISQEDIIEQIDPMDCSEGGFKEILKIDDDLAYKIRHFYLYPNKGNSLKDIEGMTDEVIEKIKIFFTNPRGRNT